MIKKIALYVLNKLIMNKILNVVLVFLVSFLTACSSDEGNGMRSRIQEADAGNGFFFGFLLFLVLLGIIVAIFLLGGGMLWTRAMFSRVKISWWHIMYLRFKHIPQELIVETMIKASEAGIRLTTAEMESHFLAGGDIANVVDALIAARNADHELSEDLKLNLTFAIAANIDLAKFDVLKAVEEATHFRVLETPPIRGFAKDGVEVTMKCRVTIRPKIREIVSGAGSETVIARVNEAVVSEIGLSVSHYDVLENAFEVADRVEQRPDLMEGTAYKLLSVDLSDIEVGRDVHAELAIERAHATKAEAEANQAKAITREHEQVANAQEARVKLITAEAEVQKAMAAAFLDGKLSIHDFHDMQNTEADTKMRENLAKQGGHNH